MRRIFLLFIVILLPACTEVELASHVAKQIPIPEEKQSTGTFKVGTPYRIAGQKYYPKERYSFTETGIASWYGPNFHGKKTANGEIFDKYELTAAHKTLQMPSLVRVTNLENGRSLVVRINDRGPFKRGRIIDLSERAAELLDFKHKGVAKVKIDVLENESRKIAQIAKSGRDTRGIEVAVNENRSIPGHLTRGKFYPDPVVKRVPIQSSNIFVQAGSFGSQGNAHALARKLGSYGTTEVKSALINGNKFYRVRLGPFQNVPQADQVLAQLASADLGQPIIVID